MSDAGASAAGESLPEIFRMQVEAGVRERGEKWQRLLSASLAALESNPRAPEAYIESANCHRKLKHYDAAIATISEGLRRCKPDRRLHLWRINLFAQCNRAAEAIEAAREASALFPDDFAMRLKEALSLPILYDSQAERDRYRRRFSGELPKLRQLLRLETQPEKLNALSAIGDHVNMLLAYQGRDDRELQIEYGEIVHRIMAANYPQWSVPVPMPPVSSGGVLRVGYVSSRFRNMSVTKYFLGWLSERSRDRFAVHAYHVGIKTDSTTEEVRRASTHFRQLTGSIEEACAAILADQLHILIFLDVGLEPAMSQLAALRLAPIQCAAWDQPVTTGLPTVNYFLSSDLAEPERAQEHYSEKLIRLPGTGTCFRKPVIPRAVLNRTRHDFGIREDAIVYLCCQYAFKYLPEQDDCFAQIARRVPNSQFVFLTPNEFVASDLRARLGKAFSASGLDASDFCVVLLEVERFDYWNLCLLGDVVLDTLEWSGGVSTFESIACGLPVVTLPGAFMRGRQSYAILQQLRVTDTVARNKDEYVAIAARLGEDREWRNSTVDKMKANYSLLYWDTRCVRALEEFYSRAVDELLSENSVTITVSQNGNR